METVSGNNNRRSGLIIPVSRSTRFNVKCAMRCCQIFCHSFTFRMLATALRGPRQGTYLK